MAKQKAEVVTRTFDGEVGNDVGRLADGDLRKPKSWDAMQLGKEVALSAKLWNWYDEDWYFGILVSLESKTLTYKCAEGGDNIKVTNEAVVQFGRDHLGFPIYGRATTLEEMRVQA
jgi:hypothetical protein